MEQEALKTYSSLCHLNQEAEKLLKENFRKEYHCRTEGYALNSSHGVETNAWVSFLSTEVELVLDLSG